MSRACRPARHPLGTSRPPRCVAGHARILRRVCWTAAVAPGVPVQDGLVSCTAERPHGRCRRRRLAEICPPARRPALASSWRRPHPRHATTPAAILERSAAASNCSTRAPRRAPARQRKLARRRSRSGRHEACGQAAPDVFAKLARPDRGGWSFAAAENRGWEGACSKSVRRSSNRRSGARRRALGLLRAASHESTREQGRRNESRQWEHAAGRASVRTRPPRRRSSEVRRPRPPAASFPDER